MYDVRGGRYKGGGARYEVGIIDKLAILHKKYF